MYDHWLFNFARKLYLLAKNFGLFLFIGFLLTHTIVIQTTLSYRNNFWMHSERFIFFIIKFFHACFETGNSCGCNFIAIHMKFLAGVNRMQANRRPHAFGIFF